MKLQLLNLLFLIFILVRFQAQVVPFTAPLSISNKQDMVTEETGKNWVEQLTERTFTSAQFIDEKGNTKSIFSKKPIHYLSKSGQLEKINTALIPQTDGGWASTQQQYPTYLFSDYSYGITLDNDNILSAGRNLRINAKEFIYQRNEGSQVSANGVLYSNGKIDRQLIFLEDRIKGNVILNEPIELTDNYLLIQEDLVLPEGYTLEYHSNINIEDHPRRMGNLFVDGYAFQSEIWIINNKDKKVVGKIFAPLAYDNNKTISEALVKFERIEKNTFTLTVAIDSKWLQESSRQYPITIDPLIGGPTTTWAGGYMPSCFMPTYNADSILAVVPAGVTVTGLYVTASFYADPFAFSTMSQGSMYFSTICANSQTFTVTGATAQTAGTAYLDSFNLMSPLICCIPESCDTTQFWVRFHLGRNALGSGCNITYIRYDPFTTLWPFQVVIYGRTPESYGSQWYASQAPICSNNCVIEVTGYARYGVAPYTFSHPWTTEVITTGTNSGCGAGSTNYHFFLPIPNCPVYCDSSFTLLTIPPPIIVDACGSVITGIPSETVPIKPATNIDLQYDSILCDGQPVIVSLSSCFDNGTSYYWGEGLSGQGSFATNTSTNGAPVQLNFSAYAEGDGCVSDTTDFSITMYSNPIASYTNSPNPIIVGIPVVFNDASISPASIVDQWVWTWDDTVTSLSTQWGNTYFTPGMHTLCLAIQDEVGCVDTLCAPIAVVPASVSIPNVITPNNDGINDELIFEYLEFYPENILQIFNRWGNLLYEKQGYLNDWNGEKYTEGTYFFTLKILEKNETYTGFFNLFK